VFSRCGCCGFGNDALGLIARTSGGLTATFRSVFCARCRFRAWCWRRVLSSWVLWSWQWRSGFGCAYVRGTDGYISLCFYVRAVGLELSAGDVFSRCGSYGLGNDALGLIARTSGGLTATFRSVFCARCRFRAWCWRRVLSSWVLWSWQWRSGFGCAYVRGTDGYISLCFLRAL